MATTNGTKAKTTAAKKPAAAAKSSVEFGQQSVEQAMKAGTEAFTQNFEKVFGASRERLEDAMKGFGDVSSYGRENVDAIVATGNVLAKGVEAFSAEVTAISKRNMEDSAAAVKALSGAKSAKEYFEIQTDLMKSAWDQVVADGTKINEMVAAYSKDAAAPINSRISEAMDRLGKATTL